MNTADDLRSKRRALAAEAFKLSTDVSFGMDAETRVKFDALLSQMAELKIEIAKQSQREEEIVSQIVDGFCTACLADLKPSDHRVECANCEGQLHVTCNDCPCERLKKENQRS